MDLPTAPELSSQVAAEEKRVDVDIDGDVATSTSGSSSRKDDADSELELLDIAQPVLARQVSSRTGALQMVGLGMYRDKLVDLGLLDSIDDFGRITEAHLQSLGLSPLQRACFDALRNEVLGESATALPPASVGGADSGTGLECSICENEAGPHHQLGCCDTVVCRNCFRANMITTGHFLQCPSGCGAKISAETCSQMLHGHCVCCAGELLVGSGGSDAGVATTVDDVVAIGCGYNHQAHSKCLTNYTRKCVGAKEHPVACPAGQVCKCSLSEAIVLKALRADEAVLRSYYDAGLDIARKTHGFLRQCPSKECGAVIDLGVLDTRLPGGSRGVKCSTCQQDWCLNCWLSSHPGVACEEFSKLKEQWMRFVAAQGDISEDVKAELRNFEDLCKSEEFKAKNMRHCPHCGLVTFKTDGCSSVTCGADAPDKGGTRHSDLGCGMNFNWDRARRYKAKCTMKDKLPGDASVVAPGAAGGGGSADLLLVRTDGVMLPPRLCQQCFTTVSHGTCFEDMSVDAQRMATHPLQFLEYVDQTMRKKIADNLCNHNRFEKVPDSSNLTNLLRANPSRSKAFHKEKLRFDVDGTDCARTTLILKADNLGRSGSDRDRDHFSKIRVELNAPRFGQQCNPSSFEAKCVFNVRAEDVAHALPFLSADTGATATEESVMSFELPLEPKDLPTERTWVTLVTRADIVRALVNRFGAFLDRSPAAVHKLLESLTRIHLVFKSPHVEAQAKRASSPLFSFNASAPAKTSGGKPSIFVPGAGGGGTTPTLGDGEGGNTIPVAPKGAVPSASLLASSSNSETPAFVGHVAFERIEIYTAPPLPEGVRQWLGSNDAQDGLNVASGELAESDIGDPAASVVSADLSNLNAASRNPLTSTKLGVCWPCMRNNLAGVQPADKARDRLSAGCLVTLSATYKAPSSLNAADGPLKPGQFGFILATNPAELQPVPVQVQTFSGETWWYAREALTLIPNPSAPGRGEICDTVTSENVHKLIGSGASARALFRIVQPLSADEVLAELAALNRAVVRVPAELLPPEVLKHYNTSAGSPATWIPGADAPAADRLAFTLPRLEAVNSVVRLYACPEADTYALHAFDFLLGQLRPRDLADLLDHNGGEETGGDSILPTQSLARLRRACSHASQFAASWVESNVPKNAAGFAVAPGSGACAEKMYCGRNVGRAIMGSGDGRCGPNNGPQCPECTVLQSNSIHVDDSVRSLRASVYCRVYKLFSTVREVCLARALQRAKVAGRSVAQASEQPAAGGGSKENSGASAEATQATRDTLVAAAVAAAVATADASTADEQLNEPHSALRVGTKVKSNYKAGSVYYSGVISSRDDSGPEPKFSIHYDDGDHETNVPPSRIKVSNSSGSARAQLAPIPVATATCPVSATELPAQLQTSLAEDAGSESLCSADKLWLELELASRPAVPAWGPAPPDASLLSAEQLKEREVANTEAKLQHLQRGDFIGEVRALVMQTSDPASLSNLWLLVFRVPSTSSYGAAHVPSLVSSHAVGDRVITLGDGNAALVILQQPITLEDTDILAFCRITNEALISPGIEESVATSQVTKENVPDLELRPSGNSWQGAGQALQSDFRAVAISQSVETNHRQAGTRKSLDVRIFGEGTSIVGRRQSTEVEEVSGEYEVKIVRDSAGLAGFRVYQSSLTVTGVVADHSAGAHRQGVRNGHVIKAVDDNAINSWADYKKYAYGNPSFRLTLLDNERHNKLKPKIPDVFLQEQFTFDATSVDSSATIEKLANATAKQIASAPRLLDVTESMMLTRAAVSLCVADASVIARRRQSKNKEQRSGANAQVHRLSIDELLGLLRRDWQPFCIGSALESLRQEMSADGNIELEAGDHVLLRREEIKGYTDRAVVLSEKVKLSSTVQQQLGSDANTNKLVALSDSEGFVNVQAKSIDLKRTEPSAIAWSQLPATLAQLLQDLLQQVENALGGKRQPSPDTDSPNMVDFANALVAAAPFLLGNDIGIADMQWLLDELKNVAHPTDEATQQDKNMLPASLAAAKLLAAEPERRKKQAAEHARRKEKLREARRHLARKQVLPVPSCVSKMLSGDYTYISDNHRQLIKDCVPWTVKALKFSHLDDEIRDKVRLLLGTFQFTQCLSWAQPSWPTLHSSLDEEMAMIAASLEEIYDSEHLATSLGSLEVTMAKDANGRQDIGGGLVPPPALQELLAKAPTNPHFECEIETVAFETAYIHYMRLVGLALLDQFGPAVESHIGHLVLGGVPHVDAIKSFTRMHSWLHSFDDHWTKPVPRPAENADVVRCTAVFDGAEKLAAAAKQLQKAFGPLATFHNGMAASKEEALAVSGVRTVLMGIRFDSQRTFADICNDPAVQQKWNTYAQRDVVPEVAGGICGRGPWHRSIDTALEWLRSPELASKPVAMVCEVQLILDRYHTERERVSAMLRVRRAPTAIALHADFVQYFKEAAHQKQIRKDSGGGADSGSSVGMLKAMVFCDQFAVAADPDAGGDPADVEEAAKAAAEQVRHLSEKCKAALLSIAGKYGRLGTTRRLMAAYEACGQDVASVLKRYGEGYHFPLFHAADGEIDSTRAEIVKLLLEAKGEVNATTPGGCSALWKACNEGHTNAVCTLVENGADVNLLQDKTTISPLYNACYRGHDDIVRFLIGAKADVNTQRKQTGATPLYTCAENGHAQIMLMLIEAKADVNEVTTKTHSSPMYIAAQNGRMEVIHVLAQAKADVHLSRKADGCTPFYAAADKGYCEILRYLFKIKADVNKTTNDKVWCPLKIAAYRGFTATVRTLVELKADANSVSSALELSGSSSEIREILQAAAQAAPKPSEDSK